MNLFQVLSDAARQWPERPAIIDDRGTLDYGSLWHEVEVLRRQLGRLGVGPGLRVGVMGRTGRAFVIGAMAALGCGAVVMPMYFQLKAEELDQMWREAGLSGLLDDGSCGCPPAGKRRTVTLTDGAALRFTRLPEVAVTVPIPWMSEAAFMRFTSGTTGAAKGVVLTHRALGERVRAANAGLRLGCEDRVLWVLPMAYHFFVSIVLYLEVGAAIVITPDHWAESMLQAAAEHRATFLYAAPMQIRALATAPPGCRLPPTLTRIMSVSSRLDPPTARSFLRRYHVPVTQGYGVIEVGLPIANLEAAAEHPEAVGRPLPAYEAAILDRRFVPVTNGDTGQLALRGPGMFAGYLRPPKPSPEVLRDGWFLTGDLAHTDHGGLIVLDGRSNSVINVAGHKVFPEEVAAVLDTHPAVWRSRVTPRLHPQLGEVVHAQVQLRQPGSMPNPEQILEFCRRRLTNYKVPASIELVGEVEVTPSGKVRHG